MSSLVIKPNAPSFYSLAQINEYAKRIGLDLSTFVPDLPHLTRIMRLHLLAFPFENTRLHYSATHEVDTSPDVLFDRMITKAHGGSWCCGANGLLFSMLRGLGYRAILSSGRVNQSPRTEPATIFTFLTHLVILVQLDTTYLVDVGFGGQGPYRPIPLHGAIVPGGAPPEEHRLTRFMHPQSALEPSDASLDWALQYRCPGPQDAWITLFIFKVVETIPEDWIAFGQWLSAHPPKEFKENVLVVKYFLVNPDDDGEDAPMGRLQMVGTRTHQRIGATSVPQKEFTTERERVRILKEDFGIVVEEEEVGNIRGPAALPIGN